MDVEFEERLCEEVRRYPHLYNPSLKQYKDIQVCSNSWREIAKTLGKDERVCRYKWKYLRDRFVKAKLKGRSTAAGGYTPRIVSLLNWLSDFVKHRDRNRERLKLPSKECSIPLLPPVNSTPSPTAAPQSPLSTSSSASANVPFSSTTSQKRKPYTTPVEDAILHLLQKMDKAKDEQSEEHRFGMMVADMLVKLPACERMEAQFEIYQLLYQKQKKVFEKDFSQ